MFLTPMNFSFPLQLVPVFEWEPVAPVEGAAPPAPPPPGSSTDGTTPQPDAPSDMRLVFKGYEWRAVAERSFYPRADWESIYRSEADAKEQERDPAAHRNDPTRRPPPPRPASAASDEFNPGPRQPDPSEPS